MRIIAGNNRGAVLQTLEGEGTRPTLGRVKEGMFSSIQFVLPGSRVLDLFAGSGQLGLEALSRGASSCVFIDSGKQAIDIIKKNVLNLKVTDKAEVLQRDSVLYLQNAGEKFDIVFLDPPFGTKFLPSILEKVSEIVAENGNVFCESSSETVFPEEIGELRLKKQYKYGKIVLTRYIK